jgi:hypothetical protein
MHTARRSVVSTKVTTRAVLECRFLVAIFVKVVTIL